MKIRMIDGLARADFHVVPGEVTDRFDDDEALRHVTEGRAFLVDDDTPLGPEEPPAPAVVEQIEAPVEESPAIPRVAAPVEVDEQPKPRASRKA
jgi:hypothetical protein